MSKRATKSRGSPHRHHVRKHVRRNSKGIPKPVTDYDRGRGKKPKDNPRRRRVVGGGKGGPYAITLSYIDSPDDSLTLEATSYGAVINPAMELRASPEGPRKMFIRKVK